MAELTVLSSPNPAKPLAIVNRFRTLSAQPAVQRSLPLLMLLGFAIAILMTWSAVSAAPERELFPGVGEADKAAVAQALDAASVTYRIDAATGALRVGGDNFHKARMLLAAQGLPKSAPSAAASDAMPLGASEAVERERLQDGREADLAHTIESIDAVTAARVHLAIEPPSLFVRDHRPPRASVMLTLRQGRTLGEGQVTAITNLIASSVPALAAADIAIVDQAGHLLSNPDEGSAALAGQLGIQRRVEDRYREAVANVLTPIVGRDGFTAEVHADLDFSATDATREGFPEAGRALRSEDQRWTRDGAGTPPAIGIPGTLSNTPPPATSISTTPPAATTAPGAATGTTSQDVSRRFELAREVSVTHGSPGSVRRLSVAVAVRELPGKRRTAAEIASIEALVRGAVGSDAQRGDQVAVSARPFVVEAPAVPGWTEAPWLVPGLKLLGLLISAALAWWFVGRRLIRRYEAATQALRRTETTDLLGQQLAGLPQAASDAVTLDMIEAAPGYASRAALVRDYVRQDPTRAAQVLREMIAARGSA